MQNITAIAASFAFIFLVLGLATVTAKIKGTSETSRKLVHILVGNWVFLIPLFHDLWAVLLIPFSFVLINSLSLRYNLIPAMERKDDSLGTVYYAVSLFILTGAGQLLNWPMLPIIGVLTMAYGDGLAAIIGKRYGRRRPFSFAPDKSLAGSLTVAIAAFIVTFFSLLLIPPIPGMPQSLWLIILISLMTAPTAAFLELIGKKGCDNLSLPLGTGVFATLAYQFASPGYFLYLLIVGIIVWAALRTRSLTLDGAAAALLTAATLFALGGLMIALSLLVFFVLGSSVSRLKNERKRQAESLQEETGARSWKQVLCNSLPAALLLWAGYIMPDEPFFRLLALSVFSGAAADTFSSEIGMLSQGKVFSILSGRPLPRGVSGGVSWLGLAAGLAGSILLALPAIPEFGWSGFFLAAALGFFGSIFDSILGASLQRKYLGPTGLIQDRPSGRDEVPRFGYQIISNNGVNLISLSMTVLLGGLLLIG